MRPFLYLVLFLWLFTMVHAQQPTLDKMQPVSEVVSRMTESQAYKLLYENQLKATESILNTIYYALSGLAAAILAVFASNWWFNSKKVEDIAKDIESRIEGKSVEILEKLRNEISMDRKSLESHIENRLSSIQEGFNREIDAAGKLADERTENLREQIAIKSQEILSQTDSRFELISEKLERDKKQLEMDIYTHEAAIALSKGLPEIAMGGQLKSMQRWLDLGYGQIHNYDLIQLTEIMKKVSYIYESDLELAKEILIDKNLRDPVRGAAILTELKAKTVKAI